MASGTAFNGTGRTSAILRAPVEIRRSPWETRETLTVERGCTNRCNPAPPLVDNGLPTQFSYARVMNLHPARRG